MPRWLGEVARQEDRVAAWVPVGLVVLAGLARPVAVEQPGRLARDLPLGAPPGVGEVAVRIAHHPLGTVVVILDDDVHRHAGCLSHVLSVASAPARAQWPAGYLALSG